MGKKGKLFLTMECKLTNVLGITELENHLTTTIIVIASGKGRGYSSEKQNIYTVSKHLPIRCLLITKEKESNFRVEKSGMTPPSLKINININHKGKSWHNLLPEALRMLTLNLIMSNKANQIERDSTKDPYASKTQAIRNHSGEKKIKKTWQPSTCDSAVLRMENCLCYEEKYNTWWNFKKICRLENDTEPLLFFWFWSFFCFILCKTMSMF